MEVHQDFGVLDALAEAVVVVDQEGRVTEANRAAAALFGTAAEEIVGSVRRRGPAWSAATSSRCWCRWTGPVPMGGARPAGRSGPVSPRCPSTSPWIPPWLAVEDTGLGIPESEQQRLFTRFFRSSVATSRAIPGSGLGLVIVMGIVDAHGGTLHVQPAAPTGSRRTGLPVPGRGRGSAGR